MNSFKGFVLGLLVTFGMLGVVLYTSCSKDNCKAVTCQNTGMCSGGTCSCPPGVGGQSCEVIYRQLYNGVYKGAWQSDSITYANNTLNFQAGNDSNFTKMQLTWTNPGVRTVNFTVTLNNNSSAGSTFSLSSTKIDTFTYTGSGSVSATAASAVITESHPNSPSLTFVLNNFTKQ